MTPVTDRAAGVVQGAKDAAQDVTHKAHGWNPSPSPDGREADARARWHAGRPARNQLERDPYAALEANLTAGMRQLTAQGKQASAMEAARGAEAADKEAGA